MSPQPLFWAVAVVAWISAFGAGLLGAYRRWTRKKGGKTTLIFFGGLAVFAATVLLGRWLGYPL